MARCRRMVQHASSHLNVSEKCAVLNRKGVLVLEMLASTVAICRAPPGQIGVSSSTRTTQDSGERPAEHCCEDRIMRNIMREVLEPIRTSKFNWYRKTKAPMRQILGMHSLSSTVRMMVYDLSYQKKMSDFKHPTFMAVATSRDCCRTWHEMFPNCPRLCSISHKEQPSFCLPTIFWNRTSGNA